MTHWRLQGVAVALALMSMNIHQSRKTIMDDLTERCGAVMQQPDGRNQGGPMNEPAFPTTIYPSAQAKALQRATETHWPGMTLRDYFAAKAMAALIAGPERNDEHYDDQANTDTAVRAYMIADEMLKERSA